jgi:hypothetical protein
MPATTNDTATAGPASTPAASPVRTKIPVPITTPTPKTVRSNADNCLRSLCPGSSVSAIDCSTGLVRMRFIAFTAPSRASVRHLASPRYAHEHSE